MPANKAHPVQCLATSGIIAISGHAGPHRRRTGRCRPLVDGLCKPATSFLLNCSVPPRYLPNDGASTPRALFFADDDENCPLCFFSKIIPFSFASLRLTSSLTPAFSLIPFLCAIGICPCSNNEEPFLPPELLKRLWIRRSVALWRCVPLSISFDDVEDCLALPLSSR
jgi:hypothetical protein